MNKGATRDELLEIERLTQDYDEQEADNVRFHHLYSYQVGVVCRVVPKYARGPDGRLAKTIDAQGRVCLEQIGERRLPLRRRKWIETFVRIRAGDSDLVPLVLNPPQRRLEAWILRQERAGVPIRIIILKARQMGFSTYIEAVLFETVVRGVRKKALVVAHDDETASEVLQMAHTMRDEMPRKKGRWKFRMRHSATYHLSWSRPILAQIKIASARKKNPGRGFTTSFLHLSETAMWEEARKKAKSLLNTLPKIKGSMAFMESTANGDVGYFRDMFKAAWNDQTPIKRRQNWLALFFAFYELPSYRWTQTVGQGRELPDDLQLEILNSLQQEEEWLLKQRYFQRWTPADTWEQVRAVNDAGGFVMKWRRVGPGWKNVSLDTLAWRRLQIIDMGGDPLKPDTWDEFHEEFPATPEQAFLATGSLIFSAARIQAAMMAAQDPVFTGDLVDLNIEDDDFEHTQPNLDGSLQAQVVDE